MCSVSDVFDLVPDKSRGNSNEFQWYTQTGCRKYFYLPLIPDFIDGI